MASVDGTISASHFSSALRSHHIGGAARFINARSLALIHSIHRCGNTDSNALPSFHVCDEPGVPLSSLLFERDASTCQREVVFAFDVMLSSVRDAKRDQHARTRTYDSMSGRARYLQGRSAILPGTQQPETGGSEVNPRRLNSHALLQAELLQLEQDELQLLAHFKRLRDDGPLPTARQHRLYSDLDVSEADIRTLLEKLRKAVIECSTRCLDMHNTQAELKRSRTAYLKALTQRYLNIAHSDTHAQHANYVQQLRTNTRQTDVIEYMIERLEHVRDANHSICARSQSQPMHCVRLSKPQVILTPHGRETPRQNQRRLRQQIAPQSTTGSCLIM